MNPFLPHDSLWYLFTLSSPSSPLPSPPSKSGSLFLTEEFLLILFPLL